MIELHHTLLTCSFTCFLLDLHVIEEAAWCEEVVTVMVYCWKEARWAGVTSDASCSETEMTEHL